MHSGADMHENDCNLIWSFENMSNKFSCRSSRYSSRKGKPASAPANVWAGIDFYDNAGNYQSKAFFSQHSHFSPINRGTNFQTSSWLESSSLSSSASPVGGLRSSRTCRTQLVSSFDGARGKKTTSSLHDENEVWKMALLRQNMGNLVWPNAQVAS